jgi:branched-chain amino acid transport system ATP-binding protein
VSAFLDISGLSASYGAGPVLENVSLSIDEGGVHAVIGPNGHGKTSLLRAISGLMPQQSGHIRFGNAVLSGVAAARRPSPSHIARLGIVHVPQGDLVYKGMSVHENLLVGATVNHSTVVTMEQLDKVLTLFPRLKERLSALASTLSGGERRMLGIGRGLMMARARLLMLDEPSLGLAPVVIDAIYAAIHELRTQGLTILVVEENVVRAAEVASDLTLVNHGRVVWSGAPADLFGRKEIREVYLGI